MFLNRRDWIRGQASMGLGILSLSLVGGCNGSSQQSAAVAVWGRMGLSDGRFQKPRAMAIDANDHVYIVDMSARIQVFDNQGNFLRFWRTPVCENGRPTGLSIDRQGRLMVADTHYFRVLFYTPMGELLEDLTIGGVNGKGEGEFGFTTDAVEDAQGCYYVSEYGEFDRIQKFSPEREFLCQWGKNGTNPGEFQRPQNICLDSEGRIWVTDSCNHRIQVFECPGETPKLLHCFGAQGEKPGEFRYPYDLLISPDNFLYVVEFGGHRVQKLTLEGKPVEQWGIAGRGEGQLANPWAIERTSNGEILVLDTGNNRVQRVRL